MLNNTAFSLVNDFEKEFSQRNTPREKHFLYAVSSDIVQAALFKLLSFYPQQGFTGSASKEFFFFC